MAGHIASRNYKPQDLIYSENVFARVLCRKFEDKICEACFDSLTTLRSCKNCLFVRYCNRACQKSDWRDHRLECNYLKNLRKGTDQDRTRLLGKVILKIKGKDWKTITTNVLGKEVSFDDIEPCCNKFTEDPKGMLEYQEIKENLRSYIGDENLPEDDDLRKIIGKVIFHTNAAYWKESTITAYSFFLGFSSFDHECIPNSNWQIVRFKTLKIWAIKNISRGKDKISISLNPVLRPSTDKPNECRCTDCSLPYGKSVLTKLIDEKRAYSVITSSEAFLDMMLYGPDMLTFPWFCEIVSGVLEEHKGVLADTNALHLKVLAMSLEVGDLSNVMKLEKIMCSIFGEYYLELQPIYRVLAEVHMRLGNITEGSLYMQKLKKLQIHGRP